MPSTTRTEVAELLAVAGPDHFRAGDPPASGTALSVFGDSAAVGRLIDDVCDRLRTQERTAAGFSLFYGAGGAYLAPAIALLLADGEDPLALDERATLVSFGDDGFVDAAWPAYRAIPSTCGRRVEDVAGWLRDGLAEVTEAFRPHLRLGHRAYAAAAGGMLFQFAERIGRHSGRIRPARAVAAALAAAAAPQVRPARYEMVDLDAGRRTAPVGTICCGWFRLHPGGFCAGCPRQPEPERGVHLREYLDRILRPAVDDLLGPA